VVVVNWPHVIQAGRSAYLGGIIPVIPPALFLDAPEAIRASAAWVQYPPWQQTASLEIEYYGTYVTQAELATLAQQAGEVVAFSPQTHEMFVLAQRRLAVTPPTPCICFGEQACLIAAHAASHDSVLRVELAWQVTTALPADTTVFVHVLDENGDLIAQADGEPAGGLVPLVSLNVPGTVLYETRLIPLPPDEYRVRVGLYDRASGERLAAHCQASNVCIDNAIEIPSGHEYGYTD